MKKTTLLFIAFILLAAFGCSNKHQDSTAAMSTTSGLSYIVKDSANKMIQSYLTSIDSAAPADTPAIKSLILDAATLRDYLDDTAITNVKIMFAHTLDYINAGNAGKPAAYKSGALTIIVAGYDASGNYVLKGGDLSINHAMPCPRNCPVSGNAANDLLP